MDATPQQKHVPVGTGHKVKPKHRKTPARPTTLSPEQRDQINTEILSLPELIKKHYKNWSNGAKDFQLEAMKAQLLGRDVIIHAATGSGKTGIAAGPHLLASSKGKVTLVISPLLVLQEEQVGTFVEEFGLTATAINSTNGGCEPEHLQVCFTEHLSDYTH